MMPHGRRSPFHRGSTRVRCDGTRERECDGPVRRSERAEGEDLRTTAPSEWTLAGRTVAPSHRRFGRARSKEALSEAEPQLHGEFVRGVHGFVRAELLLSGDAVDR